MTKAELGTKRTCPNCGTRYYDLNRSPIICPRCGTQFELAAVTARARPAPAKPVAVVPEVEIEKEVVETVSLEEADDEVAATGTVKVEGEEDEIEGEEDDTFLAPEDEEDENVEDIVGDVEEEER